MMGTEANSEKVGIPEASSKGRNDSRQDPRRSGVWGGWPWPSDRPHPPGAKCRDWAVSWPRLPQGRAHSREPLWGYDCFDPEPEAILPPPPGLDLGWVSGKEDRGAWGKTSGHPGTCSEALGLPLFPTLLLLLTRTWQTSRPACGLHLTSWNSWGTGWGAKEIYFVTWDNVMKFRSLHS